MNQSKTKIKRPLVASFVIMVAIVLITSSIVPISDVFATHYNKMNKTNQGISQSQSAIQYAQCIAGGGTIVSCNNLNIQNQENTGNNAAAQQGGNGKGSGSSGGNSANQGIGQSQSSNQNAQCVAGGSLSNSCSNTNIQNQENTGNNAAAQQGGNGKGSGSSGGNSANQGIGQSQSSNQNAQCVSGKDAIVSCDNESFQNQVNSGNNVLGQ